MNKIRGKIAAITTSGNLTLVDIETKIGKLTAIVIDSPEFSPYLKKDEEIEALFNESEVGIANQVQGEISFNNQLKFNIKSIDKGAVFSKIELEKEGVSIGSLITSRSCDRLGLESGKEVVALIKTNEVFLKEMDNNTLHVNSSLPPDTSSAHLSPVGTIGTK